MNGSISVIVWVMTIIYAMTLRCVMLSVYIHNCVTKETCVQFNLDATRNKQTISRNCCVKYWWYWTRFTDRITHPATIIFNSASFEANLIFNHESDESLINSQLPDLDRLYVKLQLSIRVSFLICRSADSDKAFLWYSSASAFKA